ncbi:apolipoprotein N-acyltransferase [Rivibacter subsaxonicus]|nr:apolipoprotein N-acyltransferase [Rivibacter subsaxonicus]
MLAAALALGALHTFAFAPRDAWWLQIACVVGLVMLLRRATGRWHGAALGFVFSLGWLCAGVWWLFISLHRYGGLPAWMAVLAVVALCAFLSIYLAVAGAAWVALRRGRSPFVGALLFAALWLLAELARGILFTGFPWLAAGYAHTDGPLAALAPWLGVYGIGAVGALAAALLAASLDERGLGLSGRAGLAALSLALLAVPPLVPAEFSRASGRLEVALIQGNVPQNEKFETALQPETLAWTTRALLDSRADLRIAPETAIPLLPEQLPEGYWEQLRDELSAPGRGASLVGVPLTRKRADGSLGYTNSAVGFSAAARALPEGFFRYDKQHLVPFGEFIPLGFRWFTEMMHIPLGDFDRGPLVAPSFEVPRRDGGNERVGPNICYEDLFGEELAARYGPQGDAPTILANISNIAWFGESVAVDQHLQISRLRTLELQRPMIRATNTGATVVIDHRGKLRHWLQPHTRGVLEGTVEGREGITPFAWWAGRFGLWPLILLALALVAGLAWRRPGAGRG